VVKGTVKDAQIKTYFMRHTKYKTKGNSRQLPLGQNRTYALEERSLFSHDLRALKQATATATIGKNYSLTNYSQPICNTRSING
jgi:hypothetical protein